MMAATLAWRRIEMYRNRVDGLRRYVRSLCKSAPPGRRPEGLVPLNTLTTMVARLSSLEVTREEVVLAAAAAFPSVRVVRPRWRAGPDRPRCLAGVIIKGGIHKTFSHLTTELAKVSPPNSEERKLADYLAIVDWAKQPAGEDDVFRRWVAERTTPTVIAHQLGLGVEFCRATIAKHRIRACLDIK
jgi:hypothetical protein